MVIRIFCNWCKYYGGSSCKKEHDTWVIMRTKDVKFYHKIKYHKDRKNNKKISFVNCSDFQDNRK